MKVALPNSRSVGQTYYLWLQRTWGSVVLRVWKNCAFAHILIYNHTWALRSLCLPLFSQFCTPKHVVKALPLLMITKNSKLLAPGYQCRLCLKSFCLGQYTRLLPCSHKVKAMSFYLTFPQGPFPMNEVAGDVSPFVSWLCSVTLADSNSTCGQDAAENIACPSRQVHTGEDLLPYTLSS